MGAIGYLMPLFINKTFTFAVVFLFAGAAFIIAENTFYQYVDSNGILHESLFMPLGIMCVAASALLVFIFIAQKVIGLFKSSMIE